MNTKTEKRCRLCLKEPKINRFQLIDDTIKQLFDILLLKLDLDMSSDLIICQDCLEVAKKCLNFKSTCVRREEIMLSFSACRRKSKQNIKFIYVKKINENLATCRLCMSQLKRNDFVPVPLNTLLNETVFEVLTKYMPEMDFKIPKDPIICTTCRENLKDYLRFVLNYLDTETKIKAFCEDETILRFPFKDILECAVDYQIHKTKLETNVTEETEGLYAEAYTGIINHEEFNTKEEEIDFNENSHKSPSETIINNYNSSFTTKTYGSDMISLNKKGHNSHGYAYQQTVQENITEDGSIHGDGLEVKRNESSDIQINRPETEQREYSECNLIATNGTPTEMCKCTLCADKDKIKMYLESQMFVVKDVSVTNMYKCALCAYESKIKWNFNEHLRRMHKDVSEIKMYKCTLCAYESKTKRNVNRHMRVHKDGSEIKMYKCTLCAYETKVKRNFTGHMRVHEDVSEIKMYKCTLCAYESKTKTDFTRHIHKDVSEIQMYKCTFCSYYSKRRYSVEKHMLTHKAVAKIELYKCSFCDFESNQKRYITNHMLIHENEIKR